MLSEGVHFGSCDPCWEGRCQWNVEEAHLSPLGIQRVQEGSQEEGTPELKPKLQLASWSVQGGASGRRHHVGKGVEGRAGLTGRLGPIWRYFEEAPRFSN